VREEHLSAPDLGPQNIQFQSQVQPEVILTHSLSSARKPLFALALSLLVLLAGTALHAQATGSIDGTILDVQGKGVFNAAVTAKNGAAGVSKTARTDANGHYSLDGLLAGSYTVDA
jgi:hypothetical protein